MPGVTWADTDIGIGGVGSGRIKGRARDHLGNPERCYGQGVRVQQLRECLSREVELVWARVILGT